MKLLIVEDSVPVRECMIRFLDCCCQVERVCVAGTLQEAIESIHREQPHLVILDVQLPDGNSIDVIGRFKQIAPNMLIAMCTNDVSDSARARSFLAGADWFFDKFFEFEKMLDVVQQLIDVEKSISVRF